jgi:hypothetical protein
MLEGCHRRSWKTIVAGDESLIRLFYSHSGKWTIDPQNVEARLSGLECKMPNLLGIRWELSCQGIKVLGENQSRVIGL